MDILLCKKRDSKIVRLKVKFSKLYAGRPVVILNKNFATNATIHVDDRVAVKKNGQRIIAVVDVAVGMLKEDEIVVSAEVEKHLGLKEGEIVDIQATVKPRSLELIYKKLSGDVLDKEEIALIIRDIVDNALTESEIAYFISGVYKCGMNIDEIVNMIKAIVGTGKQLKFAGKVADKHSIGGVPGRTTPIVVAICASAGLIIPKTSSRAITTPAGTADALEVICKVDFSFEELNKIVKKTGACFVWGGSLNLSPADDKIIQVEKLIGLDPEPQLLASILAKKISVGAKYVLIDIPYGANAKVDLKRGRELEKKFIEIGKRFNVKIQCSLKEAKEPLGGGIGPSLEIIDVIKVLKRESPCHLLEKRSLEIAGELLELTGKTAKGKGFQKAKEILESGEAYTKFLEIVEAQQGNINRVKIANLSKEIKAEKSGKITNIAIKKINLMAKILGCPLDKFSGMYMHKHLNEKIQKGETLLTLYAESKVELEEALKFYKESKIIEIG